MKYVLRRMITARRREGWDSEDIQTVLLHIGGEITVLTPSVKERLKNSSEIS
jgi:hypothetical protein